MRAILLILAILVLLFGICWVSFTSSDGSASVSIDTKKVKDDTSTVVEESKEIVEDGIDKIKSKTTGNTPSASESEESPFEPEAALNL